MFIVPILLLAGLFVVVVRANTAKKNGAISERSYHTLVGVSSMIVSIAALGVMYLRLRGR